MFIFREGTYILDKCYIYNKLSPTELTAFPSFLRFQNVELCYGSGTQPIDETCELFETYLLPLKPALNDSNIIEPSTIISQDDRNYFNNHSTLINYLQNRLLSICDSARGYKFRISFRSDEDENDITNVIESILQIPTIERCSNVEIEIHCCWEVNKQLPVEMISNWLQKSVDEMEINSRKQEEKLLTIRMCDIQNTQEMIDHLKLVYLLFN